MRLASWILAVTPLAGCAVSQPAIPVDRYLAGDLAAVRAFTEQAALAAEPANLALLLNVQGQCELYLGDVDAARATLLRAAQIMGTWATSGGEATAAVVGSESSKTYRGDPYEKAMNAFYLAYAYLTKGEPDNARAALKRGILMDAEVGDERYQADNALLFWMAGRMTRLYGGEGAASFFEEAREANRFATGQGARGDADNALLSAPEAGNLVLLLPTGLGPEKYGDGTEQELARFRAQRHPAVSAVASIDGAAIGGSTILSDVVYQAQTLGGTAMEGIRRGKAVFRRSTRTAGAVLLNRAARNRNVDKDKARAEAVVGGALLLLSAATAASADVRHWPTLPSTVQVITADVAPGRHEVVVDFLDGRGRPLPSLQRRLTVEVPESREAWLLVPSLPPSPRP
ncbi:MAG: hypothetical protein VX044_01070 [Planctomycetota bacterium]|nr:hypothetical protein [Planctomycetota bacterium]